MIPINKKLPPNHKIFLFGDLHEGSAMKHHSGVQKMIGMILAEPNNYAICMGDLIEAIAVDDYRYQTDALDEQSATILEQAANAAAELEPIKERLLGVHEGNHEYKLTRVGVGNFVRDLICKQLGVPFGTYSAVYTIQNRKGDEKYKIFIHHGFGSLTSRAKDPLQKMANMQAALKDRLAPLMGDCALSAMGHTHQLFVVPPTSELYLTSKRGRLHQKYSGLTAGGTGMIHRDHRWYANTGSFLKSYGPDGVSGYAERAGYSPVELGFVVATVEGYEIVNVEKVVV